MKVCLLSPPDSKIPYNPPDLGLGYLASSLIAADINVTILNPNRYNTEKKILRYISNQRIDIVGIKIITRLALQAQSLLKQIKKISPEIITIVGGPHPSGDPKIVKSDLSSCADYMFAGEAETGLPELIITLTDNNNTMPLEHIPGLIYEADGNIIINPPFFDPDIDKFKMPAWDLMPPSDYPVASMGRFFKYFPMAPIIASRGCPYKCIFCAAHCVAGNKLRLRSPELIIEEIIYLNKKYGIREFQFFDDNLTLNNQHIKKIVSGIINSNLNINWSCPNGIRLDSIDEDILYLMAKSGCHSIVVGIQTGSARILKMINTSLSLKTIEDKTSIIKKAGIKSIGQFIIGFPEEEEEDIMKTIDFACGLPLDGASFAICTHLPGSDIYNKYLKEKKGLDWGQFSYKGNKDYNFSRVPYRRLRQFQKKAYWKFHFRQKIIMDTMANISSPHHAFYLLRRILRGFLVS